MKIESLSNEAVARVRNSNLIIPFELSGKSGSVFFPKDNKVVIDGRDYFLIDAVTDHGRKDVTEAGYKGRSVHDKIKIPVLGNMELMYVAAYRLEANIAMIYESGKNTNNYKISYHENPVYLVIIGVMNLEVKLITEEEFKSLITEDHRRNPERKTFAEIEAQDEGLAISLMANYDSLPKNSALGKQFAGFREKSIVRA